MWTRKLSPFNNDIYEGFINLNSSGPDEGRLRRIASRITDVMMWIAGALCGGHVMANVLKWCWWRFNGYGYFWGMVSGILSAMFMPDLAKLIIGHPANNPLYLLLEKAI